MFCFKTFEAFSFLHFTNLKNSIDLFYWMYHVASLWKVEEELRPCFSYPAGIICSAHYNTFCFTMIFSYNECRRKMFVLKEIHYSFKDNSHSVHPLWIFMYTMFMLLNQLFQNCTRSINVSINEVNMGWSDRGRGNNLFSGKVKTEKIERWNENVGKRRK